MNFFRAQDQARKQTFWLVTLFSLSVLFLILLTNICVAWFVWLSTPNNYFAPTSLPNNLSALDTFIEMMSRLGWAKVLSISGLVCGGIGIAMYFKWSSLKAGGKVVAESLGGRVLQTDTTDLYEKRLINIVEEMALASGIPVPPVYLLDNESGINAFAAGLEPEDAVIGVTRGAVDYLTRDQLQGVIAHEFSHILNGDMRLNTKVLAVLHGILLIGEAGRMVLDFSRSRSFGRRHTYGSRNRNSGGLVAGAFVFGLSLVIIGALGQLFGSLIKAAVSRQREFLADASAVQFTRNPDGIGGALQVIAGYTNHAYLKNRHAHELGHFFFSQAYLQRVGLLATHPPLDDRIQRVLPKWNGDFLSATKQLLEEPHQQENPKEAEDTSHLDQAIPFVSALSSFNQVAPTKIEATNIPLASTPAELSVNRSLDNKGAYQHLKNKARDPLAANALIAALLLNKQQDSREKQLKFLNVSNPIWLSEVEDIYDHLAQVSPNMHLALIELAIPSLKLQSPEQFKVLKKQMFELIHADGKVDLFEWVCFQLIKQYCERHFGLAKAHKPKYKQPKQVQAPYRIILSMMVHQIEQPDAAKLHAMELASKAASMEHLELVAKEQCTLASFSQAVQRLALCYPLLKPRLIKGLIAAAKADGKLDDIECQLITGIAAVVDCPLIGLEESEP